MNVNEKIIAGAYASHLPQPPAGFLVAENLPNMLLKARAHVEETLRLNMLFKADVLEELGLTDHPKAELLWELAWDFGINEESIGNTFFDVHRYAKELAKLLK